MLYIIIAKKHLPRAQVECRLLVRRQGVHCSFPRGACSVNSSVRTDHTRLSGQLFNEDNLRPRFRKTKINFVHQHSDDENAAAALFV